MLKGHTIDLNSGAKRFHTLLFTIAACVALAFYVGFIRGEEIVYTHFFYIPVILAGMWYHKKAVYAALFLSIVHILVTHLSGNVLTLDNFAICVILIAVAYVIGFISEKRAKGVEEIKREKKFSENIIATVPDSLLVLDKDLRVKSVNRTFHETFQKEPETEKVIGSRITDILGDEDGKLSTELTKLFGTEDMLENFELHYQSEKLGERIERIFNIRARGIIIAEEEELIVLEDITERKRAEEALRRFSEELEQKVREKTKSFRKSEEKYRSLVESTEDSIYLLDRNCTYLFMNKEHLSRLGLTAKKAIGRAYAEFHSEDDTRELVEKVEKVIETGKSLSYEYRSQRDDGYFIRTLSPVKDLDGRIVSITVVSKDITERKNAENKLQQSEERYRSVFENTGTASIIVEEDTTISTANAGFEELSGYSKEEIEGKKSWTEFVVKEDLDRIKEYHDRRRKNGESAPTEYEFQFIDKQGNIKDIFLKIGMIPGTKRSVASLLDITFLKQAQEEIAKRQKYMESVVHSAPDAIVTLDASYNIIEWNPGAERLFGYSRDEVVGKDIDDLISLPDMKHKLKALTKKLISGGMVIPFETVRHRKDGTPVNVILAGSPILIEGELHGVVAVYTDITEVKKLETQLRQSQKMETIGILAGGVAHDLNNILSGIISYPELLLLDLPEDSPLRKPLLTIQKSGEKAAVVVQDLLTLARRGVTITEIVNLNSIISEQLKSPEYEKLRSFHPDVDIETNLEKDLLNIKGSTAHLSKTVMNLISNAAEAMPDGGKVLVSTENLYIDRPIRGYDHVAEGDYVVVTVIDTGIGISKEDIERIFEPFYTKKVMGRSGSGLGMSVVWGTVKDHNGYIDVKSIKGKGTTFTLYFPIIREELAIDNSLLSIEDYMGKGESILIVDDVEEQREIASVMLKKLGYSVTSVSSGEEAIEYMKDNSVDLLILDMIMDPGIDGLDTYKKILELHPNQKAIIASGFSETDRVKEAKKLGAGAYVKKPYVLEKIGLVIKEELEK